jgi:hypothetical protein
MRTSPTSHVFLVTDEEYGRNISKTVLGDKVKARADHFAAPPWRLRLPLTP